MNYCMILRIARACIGATQRVLSYVYGLGQTSCLTTTPQRARRQRDRERERECMCVCIYIYVYVFFVCLLHTYTQYADMRI